MATHASNPWWNINAGERDVLEEIFWTQSASRSQLSERLGLSKSRANAIVSSLQTDGLIVETGTRASTGGRRAEDLALNSNLGVIVAIDLGATSLDLALLTPNMTLLDARSEDVDVRQGPGPVMTRVKHHLRDLLRAQNLDPTAILAVGMGVPGPVEFDSGLLVDPPIMPGWGGFSIRDDLAELTTAPVFVDNDVNILALGELWHGRRFASDFIVVKVGTGIGCGVVSGGRIYRGANGAAGDVGHICVDPLGPVCHCGNVGCVEALAAGPAIARAATHAAQAGESPQLQRWLLENGRLTPHDVGRASREGDPVSNAIVQQSGLQIGRMLATLVNFYNPSHIVLAGGIVNLGPLWLASIRQSVYHRSLALSTRHLEIRCSTLDTRAGLVGAGALSVLSTLRQDSPARTASRRRELA